MSDNKIVDGLASWRALWDSGEIDCPVALSQKLYGRFNIPYNIGFFDKKRWALTNLNNKEPYLVWDLQRHAKVNKIDSLGSYISMVAGLYVGQGEYLPCFCPADTGYTIIDMDKVRNRETGYIHPAALNLIQDLNTYTEYSMSARGFHLIIKGILPKIYQTNYVLPPDKENRITDAHIEVCSGKHFFTLTGARITINTIEYNTINEGMLPMKKWIDGHYPEQIERLCKEQEDTDLFNSLEKRFMHYEKIDQNTYNERIAEMPSKRRRELYDLFLGKDLGTGDNSIKDQRLVCLLVPDIIRDVDDLRAILSTSPRGKAHFRKGISRAEKWEGEHNGYRSMYRFAFLSAIKGGKYRIVSKNSNENE